MSLSEGILVANPKGSNVDVKITFTGRDGAEKKLQTLRPGEGIRVDKMTFQVAAVRRPPRLLLNGDGTCVPDTPSR